MRPPWPGSVVYVTGCDFRCGAAFEGFTDSVTREIVGAGGDRPRCVGTGEVAAQGVVRAVLAHGVRIANRQSTVPDTFNVLGRFQSESTGATLRAPPHRDGRRRPATRRHSCCRRFAAGAAQLAIPWVSLTAIGCHRFAAQNTAMARGDSTDVWDAHTSHFFPAFLIAALAPVE